MSRSNAGRGNEGEQQRPFITKPGSVVSGVLRNSTMFGELISFEFPDLSEMRGPAPVEEKLYLETDPSRELRVKLVEQHKAMPRFETSRVGKPFKRDCSEIDQLRKRD